MAEERRFINYAPNPDRPDWRWRGTVERADGQYKGRSWPGETVECVIHEMDRDLGARPEAEYQVQG